MILHSNSDIVHRLSYAKSGSYTVCYFYPFNQMDWTRSAVYVNPEVAKRTLVSRIKETIKVGGWS